ncbi:MAG: pirin family protein [Gemmataceae bacterium]
MIQIRTSQDRGRTTIDWLNSHHSFSFGDYYDPDNVGFRSLRVINEDWVKPGAGFGMHPHRDMEIITYIVEGALEHKDSMGNGSVIRAGDVQRMSAGTGILHGEFNPSVNEPVHLLQIWLLPDRRGIRPEYDQQTIPEAEKRGRLRLLVSPDGRDGSMKIHQNALLYGAVLQAGDLIEHPIAAGRHAWVQIIRGQATLNGKQLQAGDGASVSNEGLLKLSPQEETELLLFDLA